MSDVENKIPEEEEKPDVIDEALFDMLEELIAVDDDDEEFEDRLDGASSIMFQVIGELVDEEEILEVPDDGETDGAKKKWIDESLPIIKERLENVLNALEQGEELDSDYSEELDSDEEA